MKVKVSKESTENLEENSPSQPNIIFIFPDQWRGDALSFLGHSVVETPFIDQMAHEGVCFTNAYTPCPSCIAARAALATGMEPSAAGRMGYRDYVPWNYPSTFMKSLRNNGYQTMCVGKTHFHPPRARLGFEELELYEMPFLDWEHPSDYHLWLKEKSGGMVRDTITDLESNSMIVHPWTHSEELHPNSWNTTRAIELLERRDPTRPFFMQLSFHRPHPPLDPVASYFARYQGKKLPPIPCGEWALDHKQKVKCVSPGKGEFSSDILDRARRAYYAQISHIDYQIGRLLRYLNGRQLKENTWIIFSSDHGELLGDHYMYRKANAFEGSVHIPMIIKPPSGTNEIETGRICDNPIVLQDLAPTFLELGKVEIPKEMTADSLMPLLKQEDAACKEFIHSEHAPVWELVTDGRQKFIWHTIDDRRWFFDLTKDPQENNNLINDPQYKKDIKMWENRLIDILAKRPLDGLSDGKKLIHGKTIPIVRE